jgi:wyosine [tRNA(Phe)-imidazoG37] synthetase (radical SAM superfamily)
MSFLFDKLIFGPVTSRRLGSSLGINLLPTSYKYCTFNCVYCECGWTNENKHEKISLPSRNEIMNSLEDTLKLLHNNEARIDAITFAGNGEPTIHPSFAEIVSDTISLRNKYIPGTDVAVLSNSSTLGNKKVFDALHNVDKNILKLDAGSEEMFRRINQPAAGLKLEDVVQKLIEFNGNVIIQSLFLRGNHLGKVIDNTTDEELSLWIRNLQLINPKYVMIYPIDRATPESNLEKISFQELLKIANLAEKAGIPAQVFA